jgi:hypothetical protein
LSRALRGELAWWLVVQLNRSSSPKRQSLSASQHRPPPTATMPARPHSHRLGLTPRRWQFYVAHHQGHFQGIRHRTAVATPNISPSPPATMPSLRRHRPPLRQLCPASGNIAHHAGNELGQAWTPFSSLGPSLPSILRRIPLAASHRIHHELPPPIPGSFVEAVVRRRITASYHSLRSRVRSASVEELVTSDQALPDPVLPDSELPDSESPLRCPVEGCNWVHGMKGGKKSPEGSLCHHIKYFAFRGSTDPKKAAVDKAHRKVHDERKEARSKSHHLHLVHWP